MILKKLTLTNFRQFRGTQEITFASEAVTPNKNITVVFGDNGCGKTGLFRALMFCLFDDRRLSQDADTSEKEIVLVNSDELQKNNEAGGEPVEASVEVEFDHQGETYVLRRAVRAIIRRGKPVEEPTGVCLTVQPTGGNTKVITDPSDVRSRMNAVLDHRVREYFLFDGEKMERLTRATVQQRREVSEGIRSLLNIDALESAISATKSLCRGLDQDIRKKATGELRKVIKLIMENEDQQAEKKQRVSEIDTELGLAYEEKSHIDRELKKYEEVKALLEERDGLETHRAEVSEEIEQVLLSMGKYAGATAFGAVAGTLRSVHSWLDSQIEKGNIPPDIRADLIEKILADGKCICGRCIEPGTNAHDCILEWKAKYGDQAVCDSAMELFRHLSSLVPRLDDQQDRAEVLLQKYAEAKHEHRSCQQKLKGVSERVGASPRGDAAQLESSRREIESRITGLIAENQRLDEDLANLRSEAEKLRTQRQILERDKGIQDELSRRRNLATQVADALTQVFDEFKNEVKEDLGQNATASLETLLDADGKKSLRRIVVNDDYSLQILNRRGEPFLANISAGQRQIMSISFISALAQAAAGGKMLEMPLFMDTPFSRLSFEHRRNLICHIPEMCAQWILLATDTELSQREGELLLSGDKWGAFYLLKADTSGNTFVTKCPPKDALTVLRREIGVTE
jgi:DNA sulfur modification protein DndD